MENKLQEYNEIATQLFEARKVADRNKEKEKAKELKKELEKYDDLAHKEIQNSGVILPKLYENEVGIENSRASRSTRYFHYREAKNATIKEKERWGIELTKMALGRSKNPVVSCSFGIDSIVTLHITRKALAEMGKDPSSITVIWNNTLNEFPEVRQYALRMKKEWDLNLLITKPKIPLKKVIEKNGGIDSSYFTARKGSRKNGQPLSEKCCGTLKHEPMRRAIKENSWDLVLNGVRADESRQRLQAGLRDGEYFYSKSEWKAYTCRPIMWFNDSDIWEYVEQENIPYNDLYKKNMILEYPKDNKEIVRENIDILKDNDIDIKGLTEQQTLIFSRKQATILKKLGYNIFTPRTGCMMCPIPIKYGYMQWIRLQYPKVYNSMVYNLGYGKALLEMVPQDVKDEIEFVTGIKVDEENADQYLKEILNAKPCTLDRFN